MKHAFIRMTSLFLGCLALLSVSGLAQRRQPGAWADPGFNLKDEQLAKLQEVRPAFQEKLMPLQLKWRRAQMKRSDLMLRGSAEKGIDSATAELNKIDAEIEKAYQAHWNDVRSLLDEKQRILFDRFGGLGLGFGWGRSMTPRWGMEYGPASGPGMSRGFGPGRGAGWGRGTGRGYCCSWIRWR